MVPTSGSEAKISFVSENFNLVVAPISPAVNF